MRELKKWIIVGIMVLSFALLTGYGRSRQSESSIIDEEYFQEMLMLARQQGHNEIYIQMKYFIGANISEEKYNTYTLLMHQYEDDPTVENLQILMDATTAVLEDLQKNQ